VTDGEDSSLKDNEGEGVPDDSATVVEAEEGEEKCNLEADETAPACESEDAQPVENPDAEQEPVANSDAEQEPVANPDAEQEPENVGPETKAEIDLESVLAGLAGWGIMSIQNRSSKQSDLKEEETV
jgi:hypothetical protein